MTRTVEDNEITNQPYLAPPGCNHQFYFSYQEVAANRRYSDAIGGADGSCRCHWCMVVGGEVMCYPLLMSVVGSRGHGRRLVAIAAVVLLVALNPRGEAESGEADAGSEPDSRRVQAPLVVLLHRVAVVSFDGLRPSSVGGLVTGLKGSPLEEELVLATERRLHMRRLLRHVEQVAASAPAATTAWVGPPQHALALRLFSPHGAAAKWVIGGAGEDRVLRVPVALVAV